FLIEKVERANVTRRIVVLLLGAALLAQLACGDALKSLRGDGSTTKGAPPAPHFKPGFNLFTPEQDIEVGKESAQEIAQQVPLLNDSAVVNYVRQLGA